MNYQAKIDLKKLNGTALMKGKKGQTILCIDLVEAGLFEGEKGIYLDAVIFVNDDADKYGNNGSIALSKKKDSQLPTIYLGNIKKLGQNIEKKVEPLKEAFDGVIDDNPNILPF